MSPKAPKTFHLRLRSRYADDLFKEFVVPYAIYAMSALLVAICFAAVVVLLVRHTTQSALARLEQARIAAQLGDAMRLLGDMGQALGQARQEAQLQAERAGAQAAQVQAQNLGVLQTQVKDIVAMTHAQLEGVRGAMQERLTHLSGNVTQQLGQHSKVIMEVRGQLGTLGEAAKQMQTLGTDIASLQDILRAPKLRGNLGELLLEEILRQVLPSDAYTMQYRMPVAETGSYVTVDAIIRLGERLVPVDSKFPLESFQRLLSQPDADRVKQRRAFLDVVRGHIDCVADKYIRPDSGTYDFALAYLPAENVYYEAMVRQGDADDSASITSYAAQRKVIVVSPNTMYAYLLTVAYGLRGLHIEQQAEAIRGKLSVFNKRFVKFYQLFEKVGRDLGRAQLGYDEVNKRAVRLNEQVSDITGAAEDLEAADPASFVPVTAHGASGSVHPDA